MSDRHEYPLVVYKLVRKGRFDYLPTNNLLLGKYVVYSLLVGTSDGRTQSARAWLSGPEFQDLNKRTLGFKTSIDGQLRSGFQDLDRRTDGDLSVKIVGTRDGRTQSARAWLLGPEFQDLEKQTLGFRTSINGHWVSGPRQTDSWDLGFRTSKQSAKQKTRGRRGSDLSSFLKKTRSCVRPSVRPGRFCHRKC